MTLTYTIEDLENQVCEMLEAENLDEIHRILVGIQPADLADMLERLKPEEALLVFQQFTPEEQSDILHDLGSDSTRAIFALLQPQEIGSLLDQMPMDDVAGILSDDVPERQDELLSAMQPQDAAEVRDMLKYPRQSAGRLMTEKFARISAEMTVEQVLQFLKRIDPEVETLTDLYVLDNTTKQLIGVVSLRELVISPTGSQIKDIMTTEIITVSPETDQEDVARLVSRYDFLAVPVVTPDQHMLGIVTVDDIIHVLVQESTEDQLKFAGVEGGSSLNQPYFTIPMWKVIRSRIGWLLLLFIAGTLTGSVLGAFEYELSQVIALSFFIPLLIGTGGNTGAQTVSTIIRGMALKEIRQSDILRVLQRELLGGLLLGLLLGVVAFGFTRLQGGVEVTFSVVVAVTILAICTWANVISALIPLIAQRLKIDPAVVCAPLITTLVDATGLLIYMLIAKALLEAI